MACFRVDSGLPGEGSEENNLNEELEGLFRAGARRGEVLWKAACHDGRMVACEGLTAIKGKT